MTLCDGAVEGPRRIPNPNLEGEGLEIGCGKGGTNLGHKTSGISKSSGTKTIS